VKSAHGTKCDTAYLTFNKHKELLALNDPNTAHPSYDTDTVQVWSVYLETLLEHNLLLEKLV